MGVTICNYVDCALTQKIPPTQKHHHNVIDMRRALIRKITPHK